MIDAIDPDDAIDQVLGSPPCPASEAEAKAERLRTRNARVEANLGLVGTIARGFERRGVELPDLVQFGTLGLIRAAELFDEGRGVHYSTYAAYESRTNRGLISGFGFGYADPDHGR